MERAIEIRTLDGKSVAVSVAADRSIADLKARLRESFAPAKNSPNFHLFFKGAKLRLESRIDSHLIEHGDFFVFIPFTKRSRQLPLEHDPSQPSTAPSASDSAWLDLMSDLSFLSDTSRSDPSASNCNPSKHSSAGKEEREEVLMGRSFRKSSLMTMRKRKLDSSPAPENSSPSKNPSSGTVGKGEVKMGLSLSKRSLNRRCMRVADSNLAPNDCTPSKNSSDGKGEKGEVPLGGSLKMGSFNTKYKTELDVGVVLREVLCSNFNDVLEQQARDKIRQIVESVNCLSSSNMGGCVLLEEFFRMSYEKGQCMCPSWLKKEALKQPESIGLGDVNVSDVENLSLLCPEVVVILDKQENMLSKLGSAIVIGSSSIESSNQCDTDIHRTAKKQVTMSVVINAIGNRTVAFRSNLWKTIKCCMERKLSKPLMLSLEDLILMKNDIAVPEGSKVRLYVANNVYSMDPADMVEHLRQGIGKNGQIVHVEEIDAKEAVYVELPNDLSNPLRAALSDIGISRLYSHQAEAVQASLCGKNVLVATSTSSGKSLCYNLPVLEALSQNLCSCALYVFPTKALAQDQLRALLEMTRGLDIGLKIGVYDGDTSQQNRMSIRDNARLLITNPDMLHISILPYHGRFQRILSNLRYVVIDETHAYKGAFGCHTALILRRLRRICSHVYGSDPSFIFCTATSANPREHAMELASLPDLEVIQKDGSPCGPKYFILWNPPLCSTNASRAPTNANNSKTVNDEITKRSSPIWQVAYLFAEMVQHGLRCIAFCKTRKLCELVLCYTREVLLETAKDLVDSIRVYRAGYTPEDRRRIEADLFEGKLLGVAATNALELGIDVGHIDATLHLGFPGSVASLWQQAGRSGRRSKPSLAVYVAFEGPLDQYFMKFPHKLFQSPIEHCKVDAQNQKVLEQHIACAANELALCLQYDEKYFGSGLDSAIMTLKNKGYLGNNPSGVSSGKMWSYIGPEPRPSHVVSIRAIEANKFKVIDKSSNEVLEEVEESKAFFQVYEGAVYMNQGNTYLVKYLDLSARIAFCQKADLKYYTKTQDCTDIHVFGGDLAYQPVKGSAFKYARTTAQEQACKVTTKWFGFYRVWRKSNQIFDRVELTLPTYSYESRAAWIRVPESIKTTVETQGFLFREGLHAASHALLNVVPLYMMCSASDLGTDCANPHDSRAFPERILLYDKHPGGIGITAQVQLLFRDLLSAAFDLVSTCRCLASAGCPNCVQALSCSEYNEVLNKEAAIIILKGVIESEKLCFKSK